MTLDASNFSFTAPNGKTYDTNSSYWDMEKLYDSLSQRLDLANEEMETNLNAWEDITEDNGDGTASVPKGYLDSMLGMLELSAEFIGYLELKDACFTSVMMAMTDLCNAVSRFDWDEVAAACRQVVDNPEDWTDRDQKAFENITLAIQHVNEVINLVGKPILSSARVKESEITDDGEWHGWGGIIEEHRG